MTCTPFLNTFPCFSSSTEKYCRVFTRRRNAVIWVQRAATFRKDNNLSLIYLLLSSNCIVFRNIFPGDIMELGACVAHLADQESLITCRAPILIIAGNVYIYLWGFDEATKNMTIFCTNLLSLLPMNISCLSTVMYLARYYWAK